MQCNTEQIIFLPTPLYACIESLLCRSNDTPQCWLWSFLYFKYNIGVIGYLIINLTPYLFLVSNRTIFNMIMPCKTLQCARLNQHQSAPISINQLKGRRRKITYTLTFSCIGVCVHIKVSSDKTFLSLNLPEN